MEALHLIAMKSDGALRDALSIFDQIASFTGNNITYDSTLNNLHVLDYEHYFNLLDHLKKEDLSAALLELNTILEKGFDGQMFLQGLSDHFRNLLIAKDPRTLPILDISETVQNKYIEQSKAWERNQIVRGLFALSKADTQFKTSKNARLLLEVALLELGSLQQESEKKKSLTDPIDILPSQASLRKPVQGTNKPEAPLEEVKSQEVVKKIPSTQAPTPVAESTNTISIKSEMEAQRKQTSQPVGNLPREVVSLSDLKKFSRQYAHEVREAGKETFFHALIKRDPLLDDETITLTLDNQVQVEYIRPILQEYVNFLRQSLKNGFLEIKLDVIDNPTEVQKPVTGKDKFQAMARKNPNIHTLKNRFNLDIEY